MTPTETQFRSRGPLYAPDRREIIERRAAEIMAGDCVRVDGRWQTVEHAAGVGALVELIMPDNTGHTFGPDELITALEE